MSKGNTQTQFSKSKSPNIQHRSKRFKKEKKVICRSTPKITHLKNLLVEKLTPQKIPSQVIRISGKKSIYGKGVYCGEKTDKETGLRKPKEHQKKLSKKFHKNFESEGQKLGMIGKFKSKIYP